MRLLGALLVLLCWCAAAQAQSDQICVTSPSQTANYNQLCLTASSLGGKVSVTNFGSATGGLDISASALSTNQLQIGFFSSPAAWLISGNPILSAYATVGDASTILNDFGLVVAGHTNGSSADDAALRGYAQVNVPGYTASTSNTWLRAVEGQVSLGTGTVYGAGNEKIAELGMHTQVAGNGTTAISGAQIYCSHTGWLASGTRCDSALYLYGEDGWNYGLYYVDTDGATVLASIDQHGSATFRGITGLGSTGLNIERDGVIGNQQISINGFTNSNKQLLIGFDTTQNLGFIQAVFQGTAFEPLLLNPQGGAVTAGGTLGVPQATWADNQTCTAGQISVDASFIYVCTATNTVKRAALSSF
jgi:hypothetical protein